MHALNQLRKITVYKMEKYSSQQKLIQALETIDKDEDKNQFATMCTNRKVIFEKPLLDPLSRRT